MHNTRIAPSPTGLFHIGTARTAYFNYLAAKASGGKFILRIDDTDAARNTQENVDVIFNSMRWLGLNPDEVHYQSQRTELYNTWLSRLRDSGLAVQGNEGEWRLNLDTKPIANWKDSIGGDIVISDKDFEFARSMVIARNSGSPLYNFASVVDDMELGINLVIRGTDHISNTAKQELIRWALWTSVNMPMPDMRYAHVGLITIGNEKMSKRKPEHAEYAALQGYIDKGISPEAMLNFLLRMGWGPRQDDKTTAVLPMGRALELFLDGGRMKSSSAKLDLPKLDAYNRKYKSILAKV